MTSTGRLDEAHAAAAEALKLFPDYHYALASLARVHSAQGRYSEAARLMQRRHELAPHPENLFDAALAMKRAGFTAEARTAFEKFERLALAAKSALTPRPPLPCAGEGEPPSTRHDIIADPVTSRLPLARARERGAGGEGFLAAFVPRLTETWFC